MKTRWIMMVLCVAVLAVTLAIANVATAQGKTASILVITQEKILNRVDAKFEQKITADGYGIDACYVDEVTWDKLKQYDIAVIQWLGMANKEDEFAAFKNIIPVLNQFVENGGGILVFYNAVYNNSHFTFNEFLKPFGAEILDESVFDTDPDNSFQQKIYLKKKFFWTSNIAKHPITQEITKLLYPASWFTAPIKVNDTWQILVRGEETAKSQNLSFKEKATYSSEPPIMAIKDTGNGRIVLYAVHPTWLLQAGYHRIWEGIVLDKGNNYQLLKQSFDWLQEPALQSAALGGWDGTKTPLKLEDVYAVLPDETQNSTLNVYKGVIGAQTTYSSYASTVKDYCDKAKQLDLSYLVFTEDFAKMNRDDWPKLVEDCENESTDTFVAIPGIHYFDINGNKYVLFNMPKYIDKELLDKDDPTKVANTSGVLFWLDWPTLALANSNLNPPATPLILKFYTSLTLFSYENGKLVDDSSEWYKKTTADYYWTRPMTWNKMTSPESLDNLNGYQTYALAKDVQTIPEAFRRQLNKTPWGNHIFVSSGPIIKDFRIVGNGWTIDPWETYYLWNAGDVSTMHIDISSDNLITDVTLYKGAEVYRHFMPNAKEFKTNFSLLWDKSGPFYLEITDINGKKAYSYNLTNRANYFWSQMCADLQNTLQGCIQPLENGSFVMRGERRDGWGGMGGHVTGWGPQQIGPAVPSPELMPEGLDAIYSGFSTSFASTVYMQNGKHEGAVSSRLPFVMASGDVSINDISYTQQVGGKPNEYMDCYSKVTAFPVIPNTYNIILMDQKVVIKEDITLDNRDGLEITFAGINGHSSVFPNYTYIKDDGVVMRGERETLDKPVVDTLQSRGFAAFWPQFWGEGAIYTLDDTKLDVSIDKNAIMLGLDAPNMFISKGTVFHNRFMFVRGNGKYPDDTIFQQIRDIYGFDGSINYDLKLSQGRVVNTVGTLDLQAKNGGAAGSFDFTNVPTNMLVTVEGVNDKTTVALYDKDSKTVRIVGAYDNTAYVTVKPGTKMNFYLGNILIPDDTDVMIDVMELSDDAIRYEVHNPTQRTIDVAIGAAVEIDILAGFSAKMKLKPGEMQVIEIGLGKENQ